MNKMVVVHYSLDGPLKESERQDLKAVKAAYLKFKAASGGITNGSLAIDFALQRIPEVNPNKLYSAGHSSAGTVSLLLAATDSRINACIAYAAEYDVQRRFRGLAQDTRYRRTLPGLAMFARSTSPLALRDAILCPVFVFHASSDRVVAVKESRRFVGLLKRTNKNVTYVEGSRGGHYNSMIKQGIPKAIKWLKSL